MGSLNVAATIMASRKELGWLAQINRGPLMAIVLASGRIKPGQKILRASLISGFRKR
jgi:hypothetical protein